MNEKLLSTINIEKQSPLEKLFRKFREERDLMCGLFFRTTINDIIRDYKIFQEPKKWDLTLNFVPFLDVLKLLTEVSDKQTLGGMDLAKTRERITLSAVAVLLGLGHYAFFTGQNMDEVFTIRGAAAAAYIVQFGSDDANALLASMNNSYPRLRKLIIAVRNALVAMKHPIRVSRLIERKVFRSLRKRQKT